MTDEIDIDTLEGFLKLMANAAASTFKEHGEVWPRVVIDHDDENEKRTIALMSLNHLDKELWQEAILVGWLGVDNPRRLCFMTEMWIKTVAVEGGKEEIDRLRGGGSIAEDPERGEGIIYVAESLSEKLIYFQTITRDADGKGTLGELNRLVGMEGRFVSFLKDLPDG
jgi:hypothetical protein